MPTLHHWERDLHNRNHRLVLKGSVFGTKASRLNERYLLESSMESVVYYKKNRGFYPPPPQKSKILTNLYENLLYTQTFDWFIPFKNLITSTTYIKIFKNKHCRSCERLEKSIAYNYVGAFLINKKEKRVRKKRSSLLFRF